MTSTPLRAGEKDRSIPRAYSELSLERRLLVTPDTTINISSISRVVVTGTTVAGEKRMTPLAKLLIFAAPPILTLAGLVSGSAVALALLVVIAIAAATAGYIAPKEIIREDEKTQMLAVYTIDGGEFRFLTNNLTVLNNARTLIANRMSETGDGLPIKIDFAKGLITTTAIAVKQQADAAAQKAAAPQATSDRSELDDDEDDLDEDDEEDDLPEIRPSYRRGNGGGANSKANGSARSNGHANGYGAAEPTARFRDPRQLDLTLDPHLGEPAPQTRINYGELVPAIEQWHRTAAGSRGWEEAADLLFELEHLAKTGTPEPAQRARIRTLAIELSSRLNAYPPALQLMQAVMRAAGY